MTIYLNKLPDIWPDYLGCDLETTSLDPHSGKVLSISLSDGKDVWVFLHFHGFTQLIPLLENSNSCLLFHNAKFDLKWLKKTLGVDVQNVYCTMLAEQVIDGGRGNPMGLDDVLARRLGVVMDKEVRTTFHDHPGFHKQLVTDEQLKYMAEDVLHLPALRENQLKDIIKDKLIRAVQIEFDAIPGYIDIELHGYRFDIELWYQHAEQYKELMAECHQKMMDLIGEYTLKYPSKSKKNPHVKEIPFDQINLKSVDHLKCILNDRFKLHAPNTNDATLEILAEADKDTEGRTFVRELREYRKWKKKLEYDYPRFINSVTGKIHPDVHQFGTATGRSSFSNPNMQQVARPAEGEPNMRNCFTADSEEYVLLRCDYGQQEPRVLAQLCQDPTMLEACNKSDVYIEFAKTMYGETIDKKDPRRHIAKTFVLAVGYGGGVDKLSKASGLPKEKATEVRDLIRQSFPIMTQFANKMSDFADIYGYTVNAVGGRRYYERGKKHFTEAVNMPVQSSSAAMFKIALAKVYKYLQEEKAKGTLAPLTRIFHVIHDELVIQCHKDEIEKVDQKVKQFMEEAGKEVAPNVLHITESGYSYRWDK